MCSKPEQRFKGILYIVAIITLISVVFPLAYTYVTTIDIYKDNDIYVVNGTVDLEEAKGTATYQLYVKVDLVEELETAVISIPFATDSIRVYFNGMYIEGCYPLSPWSGFDSSGKMYALADAYDAESEFQEIIISVNADAEHTDLFNREISISTIENVLGLEKMEYIVQSMLVIMMLVIAVVFPHTMSGNGIVMAEILLGVTFVGIAMNFVRSYHLGLVNKYLWFHLGKTTFVGTIIAVDLITLNATNRPVNTLLFMYLIYFVIHLIIRAFEYRMPFLKIEEANENLERMVEERTAERLETNAKLQRLSTIAPLTKAYNRLYFEEEIMRRIDDYNQEFSGVETLHLCIFDLDDFKKINDTYGHHVGDEQLIEVVSIAQRVIGDDVVVARIGGEEFTLLFVNYMDTHVLNCVECIRYEMERISQAENRTTGSFGVAKAISGIDRKSLFCQADDCLYYAKGNGKNQVVYDFCGRIEKYIV